MLKTELSDCTFFSFLNFGHTWKTAKPRAPLLSLPKTQGLGSTPLPHGGILPAGVAALPFDWPSLRSADGMFPINQPEG